MRTLISLLIAGALFQTSQEKDFGTKFFDDLRKLFGRLQQSELDQAFRRANAVRCSELVSQTGEWKQVAFLNDDRKLGDWHYDDIDEVKKDPTKYVFSGSCLGEQGAVKVSTSFPIQESYRTSRVEVRNNGPVSVLFDSASNAYTFLLPYLYLDGKNASGTLYTEHPPLFTSKPEPSVSEEFRCKALSDPELTYRFLLCRTRVVNRDEPRQPADRRDAPRQPLGNAAYQILSDGKEASSSVKLTFGAEVDPNARVVAPPPPSPRAARASEAPATSDRLWQSASAQSKLVDIGQDEFRLRFNTESWGSEMARPQIFADRSTSAATPQAKPYCEWRPDSSTSFDSENAVFSLGFSKNAQSIISAVFTIETFMGGRIGTLQCFFPDAQTPAELTVDRWSSIVGKHISIETRR